MCAAALSCARPQRDYDRAWSAYIRGDLVEAAAQSSRGERRWAGEPASPWYWKFRLLRAEILTAQSKESEAAVLLSSPLPGKAELAQLEVRRWIDLASLRPGRTKESNQALQQARAAVTDPELEIRLHLAQGQVALRAQDISAEEREFRAGLELAIRLHSDYFQSLSLNNLSYCRKSQGRYEESIDFGNQALGLAMKANALRTAAFAHNNLGSSYAFLGDFAAAFQHQQQAIDMFRRMGARSNLMIALGEMGLAYDKSEEPAKAIPYYQQAYDLAIELNSKRDAARHAENMALAQIKSAQWDAAAEWNERAWSTSGDPDQLPYVMRNRARIAFGRGQLDEAARICGELLGRAGAPPDIRWAAYATLAEVDTGRGRPAAARQEFMRALEIIDGTRSELLNAHYRITLLSRLIPFYQSYVDELARLNDDVAALRVAESSRARVLSERLGRDLKPGRLTDGPGLRDFARASQASILSFWIAPKRSFAWLITAHGVKRFDLPPAAEVEELVTAYREVVEHSIADPLTEPAARRLWDKLMAGIASEIPKGSRVLVAPDGPLHRLNLETLVAPAPQPHYWVEDAEVAVAPSIAIAMSKAAASRPDGSVLVIGAPEYAGTGYDALPGAASEVQELRARFAHLSPAVFTGVQASPAAYRAASPANYSVIHFAAHAEANVEKPLESAVVLSRAGDSYKLYAREVIDIPIHADLVTLSACRSAGARTYAGEGLMGFAWAFLQAGARAVVAGLWDVSDGATGPLMSKFYEGVAQKQDAARALRQAKLAVLREGRYRKPFYWGAFQVYAGAAGR